MFGEPRINNTVGGDDKRYIQLRFPINCFPQASTSIACKQIVPRAHILKQIQFHSKDSLGLFVFCKLTLYHIKKYASKEYENRRQPSQISIEKCHKKQEQLISYVGIRTWSLVLDHQSCSYWVLLTTLKLISVL